MVPCVSIAEHGPVANTNAEAGHLTSCKGDSRYSTNGGTQLLASSYPASPRHVITLLPVYQFPEAYLKALIPKLFFLRFHCYDGLVH